MTKNLRKDTVETRRLLVDAAEQLFAERGIDNVGLLDISRAAAQKNRNAAQYHFGDKTRLVNAVLDRHTEFIGEKRQARLDNLPQDRKPSMRDLVDIFVLPVAEHVHANDNALAFLLISCQLLTSPPLAHVAPKRQQDMPEVVRLTALFAEITPSRNPKHLRGKLLLIQSMLHHGLAAAITHRSGVQWSAFVDTLCHGIERVMLEE